MPPPRRSRPVSPAPLRHDLGGRQAQMAAVSVACRGRGRGSERDGVPVGAASGWGVPQHPADAASAPIPDHHHPQCSGLSLQGILPPENFAYGVELSIIERGSYALTH